MKTVDYIFTKPKCDLKYEQIFEPGTIDYFEIKVSSD